MNDVLLWRAAVTETRAILRKADEAWSAHGCPGTAECCQLSTTKRLPYLWPSEWKVLRTARSGPLPQARSDGGCPFLDAAGKRCTVYEARPFGCRTFFCHRITGPSKVPSDKTNALLERLRDANVQVDNDAAPRSILEWVDSER